MRRFIPWLRTFCANEEGPTAVEYAVMLALIIGICLSAVSTLGSRANQQFQQVGSTLAGPFIPPSDK